LLKDHARIRQTDAERKEEKPCVPDKPRSGATGPATNFVLDVGAFFHRGTTKVAK
jgi:hypothetical protein